MKKTIYILLSFLTIGLIGYTGYFTYTVSSTKTVSVSPSAATSTDKTPKEDILPKNTLKTQTEKEVKIVETNPNGQSLSTVTITSKGFATNTPIVIDMNKLTDFYLADLNKDTFDELILITQAQGSGSYGEATIFTTVKDQGLSAIEIPQIHDNDTKKGGLFEGYMGHDTFSYKDNVFIREFPIYTTTDTNGTPTGGVQKIAYVLNEKNGEYILSFEKVKTTPITLETSASIPPSVEDPLSGTSWTFVSSNASGTKDLATTGNKFVITFGKDKKMNSTTDCNGVSGAYTINKDTLSFGSLISTKMFCENSKESLYTGLLSKIATYAVKGNDLTLIAPSKETLLFKKK